MDRVVTTWESKSVSNQVCRGRDAETTGWSNQREVPERNNQKGRLCCGTWGTTRAMDQVVTTGKSVSNQVCRGSDAASSMSRCARNASKEPGGVPWEALGRPLGNLWDALGMPWRLGQALGKPLRGLGCTLGIQKRQSQPISSHPRVQISNRNI